MEAYYHEFGMKVIKKFTRKQFRYDFCTLVDQNYSHQINHKNSDDSTSCSIVLRSSFCRSCIEQSFNRW